MPLPDTLKQNAALYGEEIALVEINPDARDAGETWREYELVEHRARPRYREEITWREFDERANQVANLLLDAGVKKGTKVALLLMNCLEWLPIYFGIMRSGGIVVPMNYRYTAEEIKYCLELADAEMLFFGPEFVERVEDISEQIPDVKKMFYVGEKTPFFAERYPALVSQYETDYPAVEVTDEDDGAVYFSSGTTGFPKAILLSHGALVHAMKCEQKNHGEAHEDVFLMIPPLYHTGATMHWFGNFMVGGKGVLLLGAKPKNIIEAAADEKVSIVFLLVPWAQDILDAIESGEIDIADYDLSNWRLMHIGAQPVPPSLIKRWKKVFSNHAYDTNYGLSESTGPGCVHLGLENIEKVGAIGIPGYGWQVMIVDDDGLPVKAGDVGELVVRGPGVMREYYKDEKATAEVLRDGLLLTGDMARQDEDGFIYLVDRRKDVIISGGENIYPVQVEDFMRTDNSIKDVAVIGLPDKRLGEIACAVVELKEGYEQTSEEDILEFCRALPRYKRPRKVIFDKVPRNPTGKIEKTVLRKKYFGPSAVEIQTKS